MGRPLALTALLASACFLYGARGDEYQVHVKNHTFKQPFSPVLVVAHSKEGLLFDVGGKASDELKLMAENGDNSGLLELVDDECMQTICGMVVGDGPVEPGTWWDVTMDIDADECGEEPVFSVVSMLVNTNDAFMGLDGQPLRLSGSTFLSIPAYDAGTEANTELCSDIPGPACDMDSGNMEASPGEGLIAPHGGLVGGGDLDYVTFGFRSRVAEIKITSPEY